MALQLCDGFEVMMYQEDSGLYSMMAAGSRYVYLCTI